jgi:hypothetical protein
LLVPTGPYFKFNHGTRLPAIEAASQGDRFTVEDFNAAEGRGFHNVAVPEAGAPMTGWDVSWNSAVPEVGVPRVP